MVKWCSSRKTTERLPLKAFCNKLMTEPTQNDTNIKKIILLHINGEEPCICKHKPTSWQHFKENSPNGILVEGQSINR